MVKYMETNNASLYKVMHRAQKTRNYKYIMQRTNKVVTLDTVQEEWDLGVIFDHRMKFNKNLTLNI